jgi:hypothetical protein
MIAFGYVYGGRQYYICHAPHPDIHRVRCGATAVKG